MPLRKGLIKYDGAIYKKRHIYTVTRKRKMFYGTKGKTRVTQGQAKKMKRECQKLGRAMKDLPESHKTWSCQHLIYFELLAYNHKN